MKKILPFIFILLISCKPKQEIAETISPVPECEFIEITIEHNDNIQFILKNTAEQPIFIYQLGRLNIEKYDQDTWKKLRILPCPCDAPCHAGREMEQLSAGETFILLWNREESWCGEKKEGNVRETIKQQVENGKYRIVVDFTADNETRKSFYKEFLIN